ncbi:MAG: NRDE family protein [Gammaproteobacteria bacterium]
MCTVTFIARRNGYALGMNRDEKRARVAALPPARHRLDNRDALFPSEPNGGAWIGVNDAGATLALVNWYAVPACVAGRAVSRGEVVRSALVADSPGLTDKVLGELPLGRVNPFRLVGVFPADHAVVEWRWNLRRLERLDHAWQTNTWISSGFDEPGAQQTRGKVFCEALRQKSAGSVDWLRRLHRSHRPACGPYSTCMHREDAATVSYTEVTVSTCAATMRYLAGAPCCDLPVSVHQLEINGRAGAA